MKQQINLYQQELRKKKLKYSAAMLMQLSLVVVVLAGVIAGYDYYRVAKQEAALAAEKQRQTVVMAELKQLEYDLSIRKHDLTLEQKLQERTRELENKKKVFNILSRDEFGNTRGFVDHVTGLARQRVDGLWLTQLYIGSGGSNIELHGTTSKSVLLPKYLQRLSAEKIFSGTEFKQLSMQRQEKKKQWLDFSLVNIRGNEVVR